MALGLCLLRSLTAPSLSWSCPWKCLVCENKQSNSVEDLCVADVKVAEGGRDCWASATVGYLSFCLSSIFSSALPVSRNQSVVLLSLSVCLLIIFRLLPVVELFNVCIPSLTNYFFLSLTLSNFLSPYLILLLLGNFLINQPNFWLFSKDTGWNECQYQWKPLWKAFMRVWAKTNKLWISDEIIPEKVKHTCSTAEKCSCLCMWKNADFL